MMAAPSAPTAVAPDKPRRQLSCLGRTLVAFIDGGSFGAAIGGIIASAQGLSSLAAGTESFVGALRGVASGAMRSGASLAAALAGYSGGVCSLEKGRGKRDGINPFIVGGMMGAQTHFSHGDDYRQAGSWPVREQQVNTRHFPDEQEGGHHSLACCKDRAEI